ncbi:MAG: presqualene diphosphate synthase HpnD [Magnetospirillum sp. WYHS-4]
MSEPSPADPMDHVRAVVRRSGTSFFWGMRVLEPARRDAMFAVYAFCREVDDIADEPGDPADKLVRLGQWRGEIERLYGGQPRHPVARALAGPVERFGLAKADFRAIVDGMEMDAAPAVRIRDMAELDLYVDRVACAVGRLSNRIFGLEATAGDPVAFAIGQALQVTNILRDIAEDAERDRLYLPLDVLAAHGIHDVRDLDAVLRHPQLPLVCALLAEIAGRRFQEGETLLARLDRKTMRPARMMMEVYRRTYGALLRRGWSDVGRPVTLSKAEKLWVAFRYGVLGL